MSFLCVFYLFYLTVDVISLYFIERLTSFLCIFYLAVDVISLCILLSS